MKLEFLSFNSIESYYNYITIFNVRQPRNIVIMISIRDINELPTGEIRPAAVEKVAHERNTLSRGLDSGPRAKCGHLGL
jgi:cobalamin biosynthesis protein CobD/CbiB